MGYGGLITERLCHGRRWKINKLTMPWTLTQKYIRSAHALRNTQGDLHHQSTTFLRGWVLVMQGKGDQGITVLFEFTGGTPAQEVRDISYGTLKKPASVRLT